jgi:RNA polymerase sigma-70 factor (ECF subfamily)
MTCVDREIELALVARLRDGDPSAFDAVHECYNRRLFNFLARLARRPDIAEDLLEETWLRLVSRAPTLRPDTSLGPWLFTVARNLYVSYRRSRLVEDSHAAGFIGLWPCGLQGRSPFELAAATEMERRIEAALAGLPVGYREAVLLAVEGLSSAEAAQVCGISPQAMRQRLSRARALLARTVNNDMPFIVGLRQVKA